VRQIIASIKQVDPTEIGDDTPLFSDGPGELSVIELDSLDALDLTLELKERFDPEGDYLEDLLAGDLDPRTFSTVRMISEFVLSALPGVTGKPPASAAINPA
jgi:acyl carrier protein